MKTNKKDAMTATRDMYLRIAKDLKQRAVDFSEMAKLINEKIEVLDAEEAAE